MKRVFSIFLVSLLFSSIFSLGLFMPEIAADGQSAISGVNWTKYSNNPLSAWPTTALNEHCIIFKDNVYMMWYAQVGGTIGYATSLDGISWNDFGQVLAKGPAEWESKAVRDPCVVFNGTHYLMWYQGYVDYPNGDGFSQIGFAWSSNGVSWTKLGVPVLGRGSGGWDTYGVLDPTVYFDGATYRIWYLGRVGGGSNPFSMGYATSSDGVSWTRYSGNPVLARGGSGAWDSLDLYSLAVVKAESSYLMYYGGRSVSNSWKIGLATSSDGVFWQKYASNPVLNVGNSGSWDSVLVVNSAVIQVGDSLKMWYIGYDGTMYKGGLAEDFGAVGYWEFDEASGTTLIDSSGNGNTGTVHGAQWVQGISGNALSFDGVNDYVSIPHSSSLDVSGHEITVEYWVKFPNGWYAGCSSESLILYDKGNAYTASMTGSTGKHRFNIPYVFPYPESNKDSWDANVWYHIADVLTDHK
jgi:predicted GH43/DUF377 family glycosyl hydrolase